MINIQKIGFEVLTEKTQNDFQKLFDEYSKKIGRKLKNADSLKIHLKEHSPGGRIKFSIHVIANYSGKVLEADVSDWNLSRAFHKVFSKIEQEAEHLFHISDQNKGDKR
ncbi:MAG: hypothetical protein NTW17_02835 [Candidatus Pacearchaeota archaeon]|nr:hypothetical protein [Candidatus Pacearchaeota archaeon]